MVRWRLLAGKRQLQSTDIIDKKQANERRWCLGLSIYHLMTMRSLISQGWPSSMVDILLRRCALDEKGWQELQELGYLEEKDGKWWLTPEGKRVYKQERKRRHDF